MLRSLIPALAWLLLSVSAALGDGKVFALPDANATIPDQQALIVYEQGMQTLAIETRFEGTGREFAWVVPLPGVPEVRAATTGLFPTLRSLFAPTVNNRGPRLAIPILLAWGFVVTVLAAWRRPGVLLLGLTFLVLLGMLLLPSLGTARGGSDGPGVDVLDRRIVGAYDTATIASQSEASAVAWLREHGFGVSAADQGAFDAYARDGWVFVASRLRREEDGGFGTPHPLIFRFATDRCVYPLRLTGTQGRAVSMDLYVFGPGRAAAEGFRVAQCGRAAQAEPGAGRLRHGGDSIPLVHPLLTELVAGSRIGTRLSGTLSPEQMRRDADISFGEYAPANEVVYGPAGARGVAIDAGAGVFLAASLGWWVWMGIRRLSLRHGRGWIVGPAVLGCAAGFVVLAPLPTMPVISGRTRGDLSHRHSQVGRALADAIEARSEGTEFRPSLEWTREFVAAEHAMLAPEGSERMPIREEDSPGNYVVEVVDGRPAYMWFDLAGVPHRF